MSINSNDRPLPLRRGQRRRRGGCARASWLFAWRNPPAVLRSAPPLSDDRTGLAGGEA
jgi:hypothetical protein